MKLSKTLPRLPEIILFAGLFVFSWWLMWHTFDYKNGVFYISAKVWSDFAANIPLIRSFSWGDNWPPEYPLFPGEPIRYHFLFYLIVGNLEKVGLPLSWALNLPSIFGFFGLALVIYYLAKLIFEKRSVAFLSVIFFLFNSSLSFLEFFKTHTIKDIIGNNQFSSFGPYDGKIVSAFWSLNIYTNQRHLAAAFASVIFITYLIIKSAKSGKALSFPKTIFCILIFGLLPYFHKVAFIMLGIVLSCFSILFPKIRKQILLIMFAVSFLTVPQLAYQFKTGIPSFYFKPGYLIAGALTLPKFASYWFLNIGLQIFLIPIGFLLSNRFSKKILLSFLPLFFVGFLFQFSPEIAANSKFFNLFILIGNLFSAWAIVKIWKIKYLGKVFAPIIVFFMIFSGVIDFFPIKNDVMYKINDAPKNEDIAWIKNNTPKNAIFLNASFLYHPASLAGRKIFFGWPYFSWSMGYNMSTRGNDFRTIYESNDKIFVCGMLRENKIDYFTIENTRGNPDLPNIDYSFFQNNFRPSYSNPHTEIQIFEINKNCT